ncbi:MAG: Trk family potassium uptake protein [Candidatus Latescibacteria bacterium]|nr:Trk family potassium uptake protein [Candidatus Latescibacterota bacterium]
MNKIIQMLDSLISFLSVLGMIETILVKGFMYSLPGIFQLLIRSGYTALIAFFLIRVAFRIYQTGWKLREMIPDIFLSIILLGMFLPVSVGGSIVSIRVVILLCIGFLKKIGLMGFMAQIKLNPARLLLLSFLGVIMTGTVFLMLPAATVDGDGTRFIDAFFTSTSATCVTGLIVKDTGHYFSLFGKLVILTLIQIGGLGIMTLSTLYTMILGKQLGLRQEEQMRGILDQTSTVRMYKLIVQIIKITLFFECLGAFLLFVKWIPEMSLREALSHSIFHSISAFCNAGFSLNTMNLERYVNDYYINGVFMVLIIAGGLGFVVISDLIKNSRKFNPLTIQWKRVSVHTKLVISTTGALLAVGFLSFFFFEFDNTMLDLSSINKLFAAAFQSVTLRTAGFNTIDISDLRETTLFIGMILMFIGASPSSTGGGIKTTTFAVLLLTIKSILTSRNKVEIHMRTIPHQTVYKAIAIFLFSFSLLLIICVILLTTQQGDFIDIIFEAVSAIGTVGLSTGMTNHLDTTGKLLIIILMYTGRLGPLTVALALGEAKKVKIEYPTTRIAVG